MTENEMAEALRLAQEIATGDDGSGISLVARALIACRESVKPIDGGKDFDRCPKCNEQLIAENFCPNCGRPLDWK